MVVFTGTDQSCKLNQDGLLFFSPTAAPISAVRNKDWDEALSPSFSYVFAKFKVYNNVGWGLQHGGFPAVSEVFIGLDLFPDSQIRTTH